MNDENQAICTESVNQSQRWLLSGQISDDDPIREYQIHDALFTVGRSSDSSLCLPVGCVSKNHAEIQCHGNQLQLRDLNSTNGTFLNDKKIDTAILEHGDIIDIGKHSLKIYTENKRRIPIQDFGDRTVKVIKKIN